jgi:hypothetical protein
LSLNRWIESAIGQIMGTGAAPPNAAMDGGGSMTTLTTRHTVPRSFVDDEPFVNGEPDQRPPEVGAIGELDDETILEQDLDNDDLSEDDVDVDLLEESIEELELSDSLSGVADHVAAADDAEFVCQSCFLVIRRTLERESSERICRECSV